MRSQSSALLELGQPETALPLSRVVVAELRARDARFAQGGVGEEAQRGRERRAQQTNERLFADVLWSNFSAAGDQPNLRTEAFTALQLSSAGSTSRAVTQAAAARFAASRGLADAVAERETLARAWSTAEQRLIRAVAGGEDQAEERAELRATLSAIEGRIEEIDVELAAGAPEYFAVLRQQAVGLDALRGVLGEEEAVLLLVPSERGTHTMAITRETIAWSRADADIDKISGKVSDLRDGLEISGGDEYLPLFDLSLAHELYADLILPVEEALEGKQRVYVVADGPLSRIPLGTLVTQAPDDGADPDDPAVLRGTPWLADRYALVQLPSVQSLVYIRRFTGSEEVGEGTTYAGFGAPVLAGEARLRGARSATLEPQDAANLVSRLRSGSGNPLMNPDALRQLSSLPGTQTELEIVRDALASGDARLWLSSEMTEPAIRAADLSGTRILHLATHGFTSEEAGSLAEPGLVFTPPASAEPGNDGYLAASEVVALDLAAARWVILSACNTASPSGKAGETGLSGLAQAFFYAGAESLLVSHWPVFDDIAPRLTTEALKRSESGMPRAEALQAAIREVRDDPALDAAHPAVWAPFVLVGEGR